MGMKNPQSCSSSNRASMDDTDDEKEEEAETPDPQSCSSSNRVSIALAAIEQVLLLHQLSKYGWHGNEKEEEAETPDPQPCFSSNRASVALVAIEQVWMVLVMRNPNPRTRNTWRRVESKFCRTKNLMQSTPTSDFG